MPLVVHQNNNSISLQTGEKLKVQAPSQEDVPALSEEKKILTGVDHLQHFLNSKNKPGLSSFLEALSDAKNPKRKLAATWINGVAAAVNMFVELSPQLKSNPIARLVGTTAYRSFLNLNSVLGALSAAKLNRGLMTLAGIADFPFAYLPSKLIYSGRRLYAGLLELDNAATKSSNSPLKPGKGKPFNSFSDSFKVVFGRVAEIPKEIAEESKKILGRDDLGTFDKLKTIASDLILNSEKGIIGLIGAAGSLSGLLLDVCGFSKLGKFTGDIIGMSGLVLDRVGFKNLEKGRLMTWISGIFFGLGALGDLTGQLHLQMGSDALAKVFSQLSNGKGEVTRSDLPPIPTPIKDPVGFIREASRLLAEEFLLKNEAQSKPA